MRDDEEIHRADRVLRAHQLELFVPREVAEMRRAELAERDDAADGLRVLARIRILRLIRRAVRIRLAGARQRSLDVLAARGNDAPIEAVDRDLVPGLGHGV